MPMFGPVVPEIACGVFMTRHLCSDETTASLQNFHEVPITAEPIRLGVLFDK